MRFHYGPWKSQARCKLCTDQRENPRVWTDKSYRSPNTRGQEQGIDFSSTGSDVSASGGFTKHPTRHQWCLEPQASLPRTERLPLRLSQQVTPPQRQQLSWSGGPDWATRPPSSLPPARPGGSRVHGNRPHGPVGQRREHSAHRPAEGQGPGAGGHPSGWRISSKCRPSLKMRKSCPRQPGRTLPIASLRADERAGVESSRHE